MNKKIISFDNTEVEKKIHQNKSSIPINNVDIDKIVVPNKVSFGKEDFKYFISYEDAKKIKSLCIFLSKNECI